MARTVQRDEGHAPFGQWLRRQRRARGWTLEAFAHRLGYGTALVGAWERGVQLPLREECALIALAFGWQDADAAVVFWRAGYVPPALWPLVDSLRDDELVALRVTRWPAREAAEAGRREGAGP
jgi:transcriptional regulator with XRE-family HTH domain